MSNSGGAGSGYIGNSLLSNKKMVGYNVPTSSAEGTKTESVNEASETPVSGKPKIGNGFARIKFLREPTFEWKTTDISHVKTASWGSSWSSLSQWYGTDWILSIQNSNANYFSSFDGIDGMGYYKSGVANCTILIPINRIVLEKYKIKAGFDQGASYQYAVLDIGFYKLVNGELQEVSGSGISAWNVDQLQQFTKVLETPQYADYLFLNVCDGKWHFKDLEINYQ